MNGSPYVRQRADWCERTAVVIASGPSLLPLDVAQVGIARAADTLRVISVSNAWKLTGGFADAFFAADRRYWVRYKKQMLAAGIPLDRMWSSCNQTAREGVHFVRAANRKGVGDHELHTGSNSGYMAVNLAYLWGARRIVLLGFDMQDGPAGESHFDGDHPGSCNTPRLFDEWLKKFGEAAPEYARRRCTILNATRRTALQAFPRVPLEEALR